MKKPTTLALLLSTTIAAVAAEEPPFYGIDKSGLRLHTDKNIGKLVTQKLGEMTPGKYDDFGFSIRGDKLVLTAIEQGVVDKFISAIDTKVVIDEDDSGFKDLSAEIDKSTFARTFLKTVGLTDSMVKSDTELSLDDSHWHAIMREMVNTTLDTMVDTSDTKTVKELATAEA